MEAVSELTRFDFDKVYEMPAVDFIQYISYVNWKNKKQEQQLKEFRMKSKIKKK